MVIWKQVLSNLAEVQEVRLPKGADILCAREQYDQLCIWFRCEPNNELEDRRIAICGTGHPAPSPETGRYIGTGFMRGGEFVWHVFEQVEQPHDDRQRPSVTSAERPTETS